MLAQCIVCGQECRETAYLGGTRLLHCDSCPRYSLPLQSFHVQNASEWDEVGASETSCRIHKQALVRWTVSFKDRRIELERSNCGVVVVTPSISPRVYDALARVPGDVSYEMTPQQLVYSLLEKASTQTTVQEVTDEGGPYRSLRRRSVRRCVGCDEPLDIGYGDTKQHCLNCYPVQMDELIPVDEAELLRLQVPTCPLCKGLMRSNQEQAARIECEDCSASLVEISSLADRGLDPYLLLRTPAVASELACPRCAETMRSFVVSALVGEIVVDLAPCCSGLFFDAQSEDPFLRATRVAVQEEADTHAPVPPPLKPGSR